MKKLLFVSVLALAMSGLSMNAQVEKGDIIADLTIGVGMIGDEHNSDATFTQHLGVEWVVLPSLPQGMYLSAGLNINNSYCSFGKTKLAGTYDYTYTTVITYRYPNNPSRNRTEERRNHRQGYGTCDVSQSRDDINFMPVATLHYPVTSKLDLGFTVGVGIGILNTIMGDKSNLDGFSSKYYSETAGTSKTFFVTSRYSYNDLDHAEWVDFKKTHVCASLATYISARYAITPQWKLVGQFGLISGNLKKSAGSSYNLFALGAAYSF